MKNKTQTPTSATETSADYIRKHCGELKIKRTLPTPAELAAFAASLITLGAPKIKMIVGCESYIWWLLGMWKEWEKIISQTDYDMEKAFPALFRRLDDNSQDYDKAKRAWKRSPEKMRDYFNTIMRRHRFSDEEIDRQWDKVQLTRKIPLIEFVEMGMEKRRRASIKGKNGADARHARHKGSAQRPKRVK